MCLSLHHMWGGRWLSYPMHAHCRGYILDATILHTADLTHSSQSAGLSRVYTMGRLRRDNTSALDTVSCQDIPRIRWMLLTSKGECAFSPALDYGVHVSLPYNGVLETQAFRLPYLFSPTACQHSSRDMRKSRSCLTNALIDLSMCPRKGCQ